MGLTPTKEMVLLKLNEAATHAHQEATEKAQRLGRQPPPAPVPVTAEQIEYPKWVHKGWKVASKVPGHHKPEESELAKDAEHLKALLAEGWTEEPPKPVKAEAKKG